MHSFRRALAVLPLTLNFVVFAWTFAPVPRADAGTTDFATSSLPTETEEVLVVLPRQHLDSGKLSSELEGVRLLGASPDLVVLAARSWPDSMTELEGFSTLPISPTEGTYYFHLVPDADRAAYETGVRVLWRRGHTVLVRTPGDPPALTTDGVGSARWSQPVRITPDTKPWPALDRTRARTDAVGASSTDPERRQEPSEEPSTSFHPLVESIATQVDETQYVQVWQVLDDFETRYVHTPQNAAAAQWIHDTLEGAGFTAEFHTYEQSGPKTNVIGTLPGTVDPSRVVYLTGHFDSISEDPEHHAPGADDNGSGTAAFLEAARVLASYEFEHTIKVAGFNGEEQGLWGSYAYVAERAAAGEDIIGCVNLDMIAYPGTDPGEPDLYIYANDASLGLAAVLRDACLVFTPNAIEPRVEASPLSASDHAAFWSYGYEAVLAIEGVPWGGDFCPWYHTSQDRIERYPTDYPTECTRAAVATVAQLAHPIAVAADVPLAARPQLRLSGPTPNPTAADATWELHLDRPGTLHAEVYDARGRRLRHLENGWIPAGRHRITWDGKGANGLEVGSGVYWLRVRNQSGTWSRRVVRID